MRYPRILIFITLAPKPQRLIKSQGMGLRPQNDARDARQAAKLRHGRRDQCRTNPVAAHGGQNADAADLAGIARDHRPRRTGRLAISRCQQMPGTFIQPVNLQRPGHRLFLHEHRPAQALVGVNVASLGNRQAHAK